MQYEVQLATNTETSAASSTVTVTGIAGYRIKVLSFSVLDQSNPCKGELKFGSTVKWTTRAIADVEAFVPFGNEDNQPMAVDGESVSVVATPDSNDTCTANIRYRMVRA